MNDKNRIITLGVSFALYLIGALGFFFAFDDTQIRLFILGFFATMLSMFIYIYVLQEK